MNSTFSNVSNASLFRIPTALLNSSEPDADISDILSQPRAPWWVMTLISLLIFIIVVANFLVIASFLWKAGRRHEPFGYFLLNLAVGDCMLGAFSIPNYAVYTYYGYWPASYKYCSFWLIIDYVGTSETLLGVLVTAMDRLWAVMWPVSYKKHHTFKKVFVVIALSWAIVLAILLPGLIYTRVFLSVNSSLYSCEWDVNEQPGWASSYYAELFLKWIPTIATVVCYLIILWKISYGGLRRTTGDAIGPGEELNKSAVQAKRVRRERQAFWLITLLVGALVLTWSPWYIYLALSLYSGYSNDVYYSVSYWVAYILSAVNPFLFNFANDDMRRAMRKMMQKVRSLFCRGSAVEDIGTVKTGISNTSHKTLSAATTHREN